MYYFDTGWDEPDWDDLQDWALHEAIDEISQKPIDAPEDIPCGGVGCDDWLDDRLYPLTVRRNVQIMSNIPEGATHQWVPNDYYYNPYVRRLRYYRIQEDGDDWMVYSDKTGWRISENSSDWFDKEQMLGNFKKINV